MRNHGPPCPGIHGVPGNREAQKREKEEHIETEDAVADVLEPWGIIRQSVEGHGNDACAHVDGEASDGVLC